jgi:hypothetical protein
MTIDLDKLSCDSIDSTPRDIDWREAYGEYGEGYTVFEAVECSECGETILANGHGEERHNDIEYESECEGYVVSEGPLMNYWYPVDIDDVEQAALDISHLPLCVVQFENGETGIALTGAGMDFTWEICAAFIALGKLPPTHFCDLPRMAGQERSSSWRDIVAACKKSLDIQSRWFAGRLSQLTDLEADLEKRSKEVA